LVSNNNTTVEIPAAALEEPIAHRLAQDLKEISVAEFFERNKQILGFDSLHRALLTAVKEAVDNALDACEESEILPDIDVIIQKVDKNEYSVTVEDNGPGVVKKQIENILGRLLYGSRFHAIRQSRGQQGIGISAVVMYGQLTTGRPTRILSKIGPDMPAYEVLFLASLVLRVGPEGIERRAIDETMTHPYVTDKGANVLLPDWEAINRVVRELFEAP